MMRRIAALTGIAALAIVLLYVSRYWPVRLWDRPGLFGLSALPPQGGLLGRWLRGTPLAAFELMIWAIGVFATLSFAHWIAAKLTRS